MSLYHFEDLNFVESCEYFENNFYQLRHSKIYDSFSYCTTDSFLQKAATQRTSSSDRHISKPP